MSGGCRATRVVMKTRLLWIVIATVSSLLYGGHSVALKLSTVDGRIQYKPSAIVLFAELGKFIVSLALLWITGKWQQPAGQQRPLLGPALFSTLLKCSLPAGLYALNNNIVVYSQHWLDPVSIQVLGNLKIVATVIAYKLMLKRRIGRWKLLAIGLVTLVGILNGLAGRSLHHDAARMEVKVTTVGILLMLTLAVSSAIAAVSTEKLLTHRHDRSIHFWNTCLYASGTLINFASVVAACRKENAGVDEGLPFLWTSVTEGFTPICWVIVACQVASGLLMSVVLKHATNLLRIMIIGCAVPVNVVASVLVFSLHVPLLLYCALPILAVALLAFAVPEQ